MLISVHFPKTAGSSFLVALESYFGQGLLQDYADRPINRTALRRNAQAVYAGLRNAMARTGLEKVACIHGHFLPLKYALLPVAAGKTYVAWMRDPVERLASHYHYWVRNYAPRSAGELHRRVVEEAWSLERFCLGPELRNVYSTFLWGFSLRRFGFIGITEFYETEIEQFASRILGVPMESNWKNVSPNGPRHVHITDSAFRRRIESYHDKDMTLYRQALQLRQQRLPGNGRG